MNKLVMFAELTPAQWVGLVILLLVFLSIGPFLLGPVREPGRRGREKWRVFTGHYRATGEPGYRPYRRPFTLVFPLAIPDYQGPYDRARRSPVVPRMFPSPGILGKVVDNNFQDARKFCYGGDAAVRHPTRRPVTSRLWRDYVGQRPNMADQPSVLHRVEPTWWASSSHRWCRSNRRNHGPVIANENFQTRNVPGRRPRLRTGAVIGT
jgi:hypothetical protein